MSHFVRLFKPQFASLVESGAKLQTVRPTPMRKPKPGDTISLRCWTGLPYRSKQRVLRNSEITRVLEVRIASDGVCLYDKNAGFAPGDHVFAKNDGFSSWPEMRDWFIEQHGLPFTGIVIFWK